MKSVKQKAREAIVGMASDFTNDHDPGCWEQEDWILFRDDLKSLLANAYARGYDDAMCIELIPDEVTLQEVRKEMGLPDKSDLS